jgi:hypothetical protein
VIKPQQRAARKYFEDLHIHLKNLTLHDKRKQSQTMQARSTGLNENTLYTDLPNTLQCFQIIFRLVILFR